MKSIFKTFLLSLMIVAQVHFAFAQTASILPPAKTTFFDANGNPLTSGKIDFYIPGTTTRKTTWQDAAETIANTNPVVLDAAGRALILGSGSYRQVVKDRNNNVIWDQVTSSVGSGGGGSSVGDGNSVGTVIPWSGFVAPNNYVFTYGQELNRTTYSALFDIITFAQSVTCTSGSSTLTSILDTTQLNIGAAVEGACIPASSNIISKTATSVTLNNNAIVSTTLTARFFPYGAGNGTTTFNVPDYRGVVLPGRCNMGGSSCSVISNPSYTDPNAIYGIGGAQTRTIGTTNLPASGLTLSGTTSGYTPNTGGNQILAPDGLDPGQSLSGPGGSTGYATAVFNAVDGFASLSVTGTTSNMGSGTPLVTIQPSKTINYAIKVLPDSSSSIISVPSGATSVPLFSTGVPGADPVYRAIVGSDLPNPTTLTLGGVFANVPPAGGVLSNIDTTGTPQYATSMILTSASVFILGVGRQGAVQPAFQVDSSAASSITGIKITAQSAGNGINIDAVGETNVPVIFNAAGTGTINFGTNSTGSINFFRNAIGIGTATVNGSMAANSIKCNNTGVAATSTDCPVATVAANITSQYQYITRTVDFNTTNTDYPINISLPTGMTRYRLASITTFNHGTTASLTTATYGVWTGAAEAGVNLVASGTVLSAITTNAQATANGYIVAPFSIANPWFSLAGTPTIYYRMKVAQGAAASGTIMLQILPFP